MTIRCPGCERDMAAVASICGACKETLEISLANVAFYHLELETIRARLVRFGSGRTRGSGESRLGIDARFDVHGRGTIVETATRNAVVAWTRYVLAEVPPMAGPACKACQHVSCTAVRLSAPPRDNVGSCCSYLLRFSDWLRVSTVGAEVLADITGVERRLRALIDRPPDKWYAGQCGAERTADSGEVIRCERELHAKDAETFVRCRDCGATYDVADRRKALLLEAEDRQATVRSIVRIVTTLGDSRVSEAKIEARINTWVGRKRLVANGKRVVDGRARPVYRVGDVLDLLGKDSA